MGGEHMSELDDIAVPRKVRTGYAPGPAARCLDVREVAGLLKSSRSAVFAAVAKREFPQPFKFGRKNLWREVTVVAYVARREKLCNRS